MSDEATRWKEKYLKSIEQQDTLQVRWNARLDLLRRGLVRSSLAAEGTDRAVDECMKEMREIVRRDDMDAGLAALIPRLEKAVLDSEQRRETRVGQMGTALNALVTQLQRLPLPREVSRPLKAFAKQLDDRVSQARELPLLLDELSGLQGQALTLLEKTDADESARPGLLQRLFGSREAANAGTEAHPETSVEPAQEPVAKSEAVVDAPHAIQTPVETKAVVTPLSTPAPTPTPEVTLAVAPPVVVEDPVVLTEPTKPIETPAAVDAMATEAPLAVPEPVEPVTVTSVAEPEATTPSVPPEERPQEVQLEASSDPDHTVIAQDATYDLPSSPEPSYSSVAAHIEETLLGLLDDLTLPEHHRPQAMAMRTRLEKGLNWYELLPILDDLAVLMLAINDSGQHDFEVYLKQLNERLESFQSNLQAASDDHADGRSVTRGMQSELREQVGGLQSSMQEATDLPGLKQVLENRLEGLLGTMDQHQQHHDQREQEIASRLQGLATRVASMEQEAQGFRVHLEEQRQKALIDPLTTLPNRAAWSERLEHEIGLWQKNGNKLLLSMLDLDHFKRINDNYGHLAGDKVLKIIANELRKRLRPGDFIARFGGEEFVLLIPDTSMREGMVLLDKLRMAVEACPFHFKGEPVTITLSMGITAFRVGERSESVIQRADQALYRAKNEGRNRIEQG
ncbi:MULTISPECIES: diguanylate cyclase [unclassified Pseudomonas]|uniref:GGDEF domain-containing protein n=1 Tax=unclassified Pseudomonas TaxID=196821 RepID=UPI002ACB05AE|nr:MULTISPECIES: diguanylate cyclase [unclassified Pseudomonas]MEB0039195.1 diguanylate cyclase [Pseudomonas sp. MH10]MEB0091910.1 diguanylate cyclase [Pseudomonas sp. CCI4.2]MEB0121068.1 diguanylate cyclase [Pseudomonas sp. CCI1.2]WPX55065.1 diguanylate cyclase [Pseudomonas sp. CCI4.2]WPX62510.1 diguanylate cyclase [Pseudomonas sp. MH10]